MKHVIWLIYYPVPVYSCPWSSTVDGGDYVSGAQINTGSRVTNTNASPYVCQVRVAASPDPVICTYGDNGVSDHPTQSLITYE
jgi:hypothetical protein